MLNFTWTIKFQGIAKKILKKNQVGIFTQTGIKVIIKPWQLRQCSMNVKIDK